MKTSHKIRLVLYLMLSIVAVTMAVRFFLGGSEDEWRCAGGEWVRHGQPAGTKPTQPCE